MDRKLRISPIYADKKSIITSPFRSPRLTRNSFSLTFSSESTRLPPLKLVQHRKVSRHSTLVSPKNITVTPVIRSMLNLRRFSKNIVSDSLRKEVQLEEYGLVD